MANKLKRLLPEKLYAKIINNITTSNLVGIDLNSIKSQEENDNFRHTIAYIVGEQKTGITFSMYKTIYGTKNVYSTSLIDCNNVNIGYTELC